MASTSLLFMVHLGINHWLTLVLAFYSKTGGAVKMNPGYSDLFSLFLDVSSLQMLRPPNNLVRPCIVTDRVYRFTEYRSGITKRVNNKRTGLLALPLRILTYCGAQVALQRCPILRAGNPNLSQFLYTED